MQKCYVDVFQKVAMIAGIMKTLKLLLVFAIASLGVATYAASEKTVAQSEKSTSAVGAALQKADYLMNGKAKPNAKYYIFLYSASWCGPCRAEMPKISKLYKQKILNDQDVELVHFSFDRNESDAKDWAKKEKVKFPVVSSASKTKIPGSQSPNGIPHMRIVKADGTLIKEGHGSLILDYESFLPKK